MQMAAETFTANIRRFRKKGKKASKRLQTDMQSIQLKQIRRWYAREIIRIGILLTRSGDALHEARKRIKTLLYVQKLLPAAITALVRLNTDYLDRLQEAIGQWHDAVVAIMDWPDDNFAGKRLVWQEAVDKEQAVKMLAEEFHREVHIG
jgi:CHAD domain-containing protein